MNILSIPPPTTSKLHRPFLSLHTDSGLHPEALRASSQISWRGGLARRSFSKLRVEGLRVLGLSPVRGRPLGYLLFSFTV